MTAQDIIYSAMRLIGATSHGETPTAAEMQDNLTMLNAMLSHWSAQRLMLSAMTQQNFPITAGTSQYLIGTGQTFNTPKPVDIVNAFIRDSTNGDTNVDIYTVEAYNALTDKAIAVGRPVILAYDAGVTQQASQKGTIYLYPIPDSGSTYRLYIETLDTFTTFAGLTSTVTFPPAYELALKYNLAVLIAPEYGTTAKDDVVRTAEKSLATIRNINARRIRASTGIGPSPGAGFNIYSGDYQ